MATARERLEELRALDTAEQVVVEPVADQPVIDQTTQRARLEELRKIDAEQPAADFPGAGIIEPALTIGSGAFGAVLGGLSGLLTLPLVGADAAEISKDVQDKFTFKPRTQAGMEGLEAVGELAAAGEEKVRDSLSIASGIADLAIGGDLESAAQIVTNIQEKGIGKALADPVFEKTGSPALAAITQTIPTMVMEALGLASLRGIRTGTRLLDDAGAPTKELQRVLNKKGLVYENLTPEAKQAIPDVASPKLLPSPKTEALNKAEEALKAQLKSGGRDDSLATLRLRNNKIINDKLGAEAVRQGFKPGFVQAVKTATPETKTAMQKMVKMSERIKGNSRLALDFRPTDIVGNSVAKRITFIRGKADKARLELDNIAKTQLKGQKIDPQPIRTKLEESLGKLDISLQDGPKGTPKATYESSLISKDRTSQRIIDDLIDLTSDIGRKDALGFHKLKRQLDTMIDFRKKSAEGLTEAGRGVLKDIRSTINQSLRDVNPNYAAVNDTLSKSLTAFEKLQKSVGPSIDIFESTANKSIGQDMRGLMSNRKSRVKLENSINNLDDVAKELGANFKDDVKDLALFANGLDNRFGAVAETSFKGEISAAIEKTASQGATIAAIDKVAAAAGRGAEKLRGINDFNAFQSISDLLKRK